MAALLKLHEYTHLAMQSLLQGECLCIQVNFDTIQEIGPKVGMHTISRVGALSRDYAIYTWILSCLHATFLHVSFRLGPMMHVYSASTIHDCFLTQQHNNNCYLVFILNHYYLQASGLLLPLLVLGHLPVICSPSLLLTTTRQCSLEETNQDTTKSMIVFS